MKWLFTAGAAVILVTALSGCRAHISLHGPKIKHPMVVIKKGHVHTHKCGHYHHNGKWHLHKGHIHRAGCGHRLRGKVWVWAP